MTLFARFVLVLIGLALAPGATEAAPAHLTPGGRLDDAFRRWCTETAPEHPACGSDAPGAAIAGRTAYRWLLLADVCERGRPWSYCADFEAVRAATRPCVVAYDQRDDRWTDVDRDDPYRWAIASDRSGSARVTASRAAACFAIVVGTNPLVHVVERGAQDDTPAGLSASLEDAAVVFGEAAQALVPLIVRWAAPSPLDRRVGVAGILRATKPAEPDPFEALAAGTWALSAQLVDLADLRADVLAALNAAESAEGGGLAPVDWHTASLDGERWRAEFDALRRLRGAASAALPPGGQGLFPVDATKRLDLAQRVLDRQLDTAKIVSVLAAARERWRQFVVDGRVLSWSPIPIRDQRVPWLSDVRYVFSVKPVQVLGSDVVVRRPKREASVRVSAPAASALSVVTGLVLRSRAGQAFEAKVGADGVRRVVVASRAGSPARLLVAADWRPAQMMNGRFGTWPVRPLLQAGAIADAKQPGVTMGAGFDLRQWLHVAAGRAWQSRLVLNGHAVGDALASGESIGTVSVLASSWYASIGVSLGSLLGLSR